MPTQAQVWKCEAFEDAGLALMARVYGNSAVAITQASLSGITYTVIDKTTLAVVVASTALTVSSVVFDTLQTDARWVKDSTGYNFRHDLAAAALPDGDSTYRVEYTFTPTIAAVFKLVFEVATVNLLGS